MKLGLQRSITLYKVKPYCKVTVAGETSIMPEICYMGKIDNGGTLPLLCNGVMTQMILHQFRFYLNILLQKWYKWLWLVYN